MKSSVIVFPGSNCDRDIAVALEKMQFKNQMVWHKETKLPQSDLIVVPGGFSYGDYLRCGSIASKSRIMKEVTAHSKKGGLVMGICNGFQVLVESQLLPGVLIRNINLKFICKNITVKVTNNKTNFTSKTSRNSVLEIPIAHNEGNYFANKDLINELEDNNQIVLQYCDTAGNINEQSNPNGSIKNIAGIINKKGNVFGLMPHPERASDDVLSNSEGKNFFQSILKYS